MVLLLSPLLKVCFFGNLRPLNPSEPSVVRIGITDFPHGSLEVTVNGATPPFNPCFPFLLGAKCHIRSLIQCIYYALEDGLSSTQTITSKVSAWALYWVGSSKALSGYRLLGSATWAMTSWPHSHESFPTPIWYKACSLFWGSVMWGFTPVDLVPISSGKWTG